MSKKSNLSKAIAFALAAILFCGMFSFGVSAANQVVIDFSKYNDVEDVLDSASGGQGEFAMKADGDRWVLFAECVDGYVPEDDPDGTGLLGDLYTGVTNFVDLGVDGDTHQWIAMSIKNPSEAPGFEIHFGSPTKGYNVETSITFDINPKSDYTKYVFNVTEQCKKYYPKREKDVGDPNVYPDHWHGEINAFRLDFMYYDESGGHARTGDTIFVEYIAFFDTEQAANDFAFTPARTAAAVQAAKDAAAAEKAAQTTAPPPTTTAAPATVPDDTAAGAEDDDVPEAAPGDENDKGEKADNNMLLIIIIAAAAVVVVVIIVVLVTKGKGKPKEKK